MRSKRGICVPLFDLHCDTLTECLCKGEDLYSNDLHWDISRALRFAPCTQILAIWTPDTLRGDAATAAARRAISFAHTAETRYSPAFRLWHAGEAFPAVGEGECLGILGLESAAPLAGDLDLLEEFADNGVKVITLTWNGDNEAASGVCGDESRGLSAFGNALLKQMERKNVVADVSHINERGFYDVCNAADKPFIASHSVSRAVCDHKRNLSDAQFSEIVRRKGLVGLNLCEAQLGERSFAQFERHFAHFLDLGGATVLALGFDLDGTALPPEWGGVAVNEALFAYLERRGYENDLLLRVFYENARDFFQKM